MQVPTQAQVLAGGRHVISFAAGIVAGGAALHAISPTDATNATNAITQIGTGFASIVAGVSTLVAVVSGAYATLSASPLWQIFAVKQLAQTAAPVSKDAQVALVNAAAAVPGTEKVVNPALANDPATATNVVNK